jgi:bacillaene synthase trans-acting acyltransferase
MTREKTVFMFSGQGSQYFQMGRPLFERNSIFRDCMLRLDVIARELSGQSIVAALYGDDSSKGARFDRTLLTHPAIFMVEHSTAQALIGAGVAPDITLGASLGSFAAATLAGIISVEDAMVAIIGHARALEECCEPGGMIAILADPALYEQEFLAGHSELAAVNFSSHFVVAATWDKCDAIESALRDRSVHCQRLPVTFAFHSRWIDEARRKFEPFMESVALKPARLPVMCCDHAQLLTRLQPNYFWDVTRNPIRFQESVAKLEQSGTYRYIDAGPAGTLATFLKYGLPTGSASKAQPVLTRYGRDQLGWAAVTGSEL